MGRQPDVPIFVDTIDFATSSPTSRQEHHHSAIENSRDSLDYSYDSSYDSPTKSQLEEYETDIDRPDCVSVSSLPEILTGDENGDVYEDVYTPTKGRHSNVFATAERRTPTLFARHSGVEGISHTLKPRSSIHLTPRSGRKIQMRASPRPRTRERQEEKDKLTFPLVLLHITLLPVSLPWSQQSLKQILPQDVLDSVNLLKTKATDAVLQRGILIPHPQDEVDVLEERLLEALELEEERITKCGHFSGRLSVDLGDDWSSEGDQADSGIDLSRDSSRNSNECATCRSHINSSMTGVPSGNKRWDIKIYASNGLMRSSAWAACWSEMERVDVEIAPWIPNDMRSRLDALRNEEEAQAHVAIERERLVELDLREDAVRDAEVALRQQQRRRDLELEQSHRIEERLRTMEAMNLSPRASRNFQSRELSPKRSATQTEADIKIPQAYRPKEIPLDVLVRNYIYVLAQDRRNIVILILSLLVMFFSLRSWTNPNVILCKGLSTDAQTPTTVLVAPGNTSLGTGSLDTNATMGLGVDNVAALSASSVGYECTNEEEVLGMPERGDEPATAAVDLDMGGRFEEVDDMMQ